MNDKDWDLLAYKALLVDPVRARRIATYKPVSIRRYTRSSGATTNTGTLAVSVALEPTYQNRLALYEALKRITSEPAPPVKERS